MGCLIRRVERFVHFRVLRLPGRELSDTFNVRAFWRVAPSVRFSLRAMRAAGVFCRASDLSSRTSCAVHSRLFDFLTTMSSRCAIRGVYARRSLSLGRRMRDPMDGLEAPSANAANSNRHLSPKSSSFCPSSRSFYCLQVDVEKSFVLFALLLVLLTHPNYFSKDLDVEAVVLGFKIDFLPRFAKFLDLFLDLLDAFDDRAQLVARDPARFA